MQGELKSMMSALLDEEAEDSASRPGAASNVVMSRQQPADPAEEPASETEEPIAAEETTDAAPEPPGADGASPPTEPPALPESGSDDANFVQPSESDLPQSASEEESPEDVPPPPESSTGDEPESGDPPALPGESESAQEIPFVELGGSLTAVDEPAAPDGGNADVDTPSDLPEPQIIDEAPTTIDQVLADLAADQTSVFTSGEFSDPFDVSVQAEEVEVPESSRDSFWRSVQERRHL